MRSFHAVTRSSSVFANNTAVAGRCALSRASVLSNSACTSAGQAVVGNASASVRGTVVMRASISACSESPVNGRSPVSSAKAKSPSE